MFSQPSFVAQQNMNQGGFVPMLSVPVNLNKEIIHFRNERLIDNVYQKFKLLKKYLESNKLILRETSPKVWIIDGALMNKKKRGKNFSRKLKMFYIFLQLQLQLQQKTEY